jgi:hypothetical protein
MVKLLFLCRRRAGVDHARYTTLLLEGHVPLALRHHPTMRRYVVNVVEAALGDAPALDSIGALSFDTLADYQERLYDSPEGARAIATDTAGFLGGADAYACADDPAAPPPPQSRTGARSGGGKLVVCAPRLPESFAAEWPSLLGGFGARAWVPNAVQRRLAPTALPYAFLGELYLRTVPNARAAVAIAETLREALGVAHCYRVAEHVQRW